MDAPSLPPAYTPIALEDGDSLPIACAEAAAGAMPGSLFWRRRADRLDCALVLEPDLPLRDTRNIRCAAMLGLADALEALGPPKAMVSFAQPNRVAVNAGFIGEITFAAAPGCAEDAVPAWAVVGAVIDVSGDPEDDAPGLHPDRTALREEGFGDIDAAALLESFARHFLSWLDVWEYDGLQAVQAAWRKHSSDAPLPAGGEAIS